MPEQDIRSLESVARNTLNALQTFASEVMDALSHLKRLPEMVEALGTSIAKAANDQIQAQGDMQIYTRMAHMTSRKSLINSEHEAIDDFTRQLTQDRIEIEKRFGKIQEDLNNDAMNRVRALDAHIFDLYDGKYPAELHEGFDKRTEPLLQALEDRSVESLSSRVARLGEQVLGLRSEITGFLRKRREFYTSTSAFVVPAAGPKDATVLEYCLPILVAELYDPESDSVVMRTFSPGTVNVPAGQKAEEFALAFTCDEAAMPVKEKLDAENWHLLESRLRWESDDAAQQELISGFEEFFDCHKEDIALAKARKAILSAVSATTIQFLSGVTSEAH